MANQNHFSPAYRKYALGILLVGYIVNFVDRTILSILLEPIKLELTLTDTQLGFLGGLAFAVFYTFLGIPIAMLADRKSRVKILAIAMVVWSLMTALCGRATDFMSLLLARIGVGAGEAGASPPSHSLISDYFPVEARATALSIYALGIPIGSMIGNFVGGWGAEALGWRNTFYLVGLPGVLVALVIWFTLREPPRGMSDGIVIDNSKPTEKTPDAGPEHQVCPKFWVCCGANVRFGTCLSRPDYTPSSAMAPARGMRRFLFASMKCPFPKSAAGSPWFQVLVQLAHSSAAPGRTNSRIALAKNAGISGFQVSPLSSWCPFNF